MKFTATELSRNPNKVFRAAYDAKGEPITIVHGHYSERFELTFKQPVYAPLDGVDTDKLDAAFNRELKIIRSDNPDFQIGDRVTFSDGAFNKQKKRAVDLLFEMSLVQTDIHGITRHPWDMPVDELMPLIKLINAAEVNNQVQVCIPGDFDDSAFFQKIPLQFMPKLSDEQKDTMVKKMVSGAELSGIKTIFISGLPGYVILTCNHIINGPMFRWTNYQMMNGFADTLEECEAKARDYAEKEKGHE
jgi:hypothetical protein